MVQTLCTTTHGSAQKPVEQFSSRAAKKAAYLGRAQKAFSDYKGLLDSAEQSLGTIAATRKSLVLPRKSGAKKTMKELRTQQASREVASRELRVYRTQLNLASHQISVKRDGVRQNYEAAKKAIKELTPSRSDKSKLAAAYAFTSVILTAIPAVVAGVAVRTVAAVANLVGFDPNPQFHGFTTPSFWIGGALGALGGFAMSVIILREMNDSIYGGIDSLVRKFPDVQSSISQQVASLSELVTTARNFVESLKPPKNTISP